MVAARGQFASLWLYRSQLELRPPHWTHAQSARSKPCSPSKPRAEAWSFSAALNASRRATGVACAADSNDVHLPPRARPAFLASLLLGTVLMSLLGAMGAALTFCAGICDGGGDLR